MRTVQTIAVSLENRCTDKTIDVAITYRNAANQWIGKGWYKVPPKETRPNVVAAAGADIYFYGSSNDTVWAGGQDDPLSRSAPINTKDVLDAPIVELKGDAIKSVNFIGRKIDPQSSTWTELFQCKE